MKIVWSWLCELIEFAASIDADEAAAKLTRLGLEVEGIESLCADVQGVTIAEVVDVAPHPDAKKLRVVNVTDVEGGEPTQVVCGAPNVPDPGGRVLWAKPGAELPHGFSIAAREIRGVQSAGMLCSEQELGIGDDGDGIIVLSGDEAKKPLGGDALETLGLREVVFELSIPANRGDCLGHLGVARELAAVANGSLRLPDHTLTSTASQVADRVRVAIEDPNCGRYIARVVDNITVATSPLWMRHRLRSVGVRPLSNLVDITNYVMFEVGQPLHAFDLSKVAGTAADAEVHVRTARAGEKLMTLDDTERELTSDDLLICDADGGIAVAGVMGGARTQVDADTTSILLESAHFAPVSVRRTAKRLGLHSESSHRFERHVDIDGCELASQRAAYLIAMLAGGQVAQGSVDSYPEPKRPASIHVRPHRATQLLGVDVSQAQVLDSLSRLQLAPEAGDDGDVRVACPSWRGDLTREVDLVEEVIRVVGFDSVPATLPSLTSTPSTLLETPEHRVREALLAQGLSEAITFGFTSPKRIANLGFPSDARAANPIALQNPMSLEQSVMRTSLLPNLLGAVARNLSYGVVDVGLFEIGNIFLRPRGEAGQGGSAPADEPLMVAGVLCGNAPGWLSPGASRDVYDAKSAVERAVGALASASDIVDNLEISAIDNIPYLHPGVAGAVLWDGEWVGGFGEIHPEVRDRFAIEVPVYAFELELAAFGERTATQMAAIPNYPAITRDISFFADVTLPAAQVRTVVHDSRPELLQSLEVLEDYREPGRVPDGQKGMLWSVTYRSDERTLTDKEVDKVHNTVVQNLVEKLGLQLR